MSATVLNDETLNIARPAVIIAAIRSGGTFLTHCLSNHSQIFCDRGEPLHHLSVWCTTITQHRRRLLTALLNQTGYQVSMVRLTYIQALETNIYNWLVEKQPRVIWLYRENLLRQALSVHINLMVRRAGTIDRPQHTFRDVRPVQIAVEPGLFVKYLRGLQEQNLRMKKALDKFERVYPLTYAQVVGGESNTAYQLPMETANPLCKFLDVRCEMMSCDLRPVNPYPLSEMISNWKSVQVAVRQSEYAGLLETETI